MARYDLHCVESAIKRVDNYRKLPKASLWLPNQINRSINLVNINYADQQLTTYYRPTTASVNKRENTKYWIVQKDCRLNETECCVFHLC